MVFYDWAKIYVKAGDGGRGSPHMRHEKFAPMGGPDGGDGGRGGDVIFVADRAINTLFFFHKKQKYIATSGGDGAEQKKHGSRGRDLRMTVPEGTIVRDAETDELIADLTTHGQEAHVARGGKGGLGNVHFMTSTHQAPRESQLGEPGEERWLRLELRLIADAGLVGYPNAGKSTFLSVVTAARPKIADYPFTTIEPSLGVVDLDTASFVLADIPGIIEGASQGAGLGYDFLRHISRTRVLIHLVDGASYGRDPVADFHAINAELAAYSPDLASRPQLVALTKMDLPEAQERWTKFRKAITELGYPVFAISAVTHQNVKQLAGAAAEHLRHLPPIEPAEMPVIRPEPVDGFAVNRDDAGYVVRGKHIERLLAMTDLSSDDSLIRLQLQLKKLGVSGALEKAGVQPGDLVKFGKIALYWASEEMHPHRQREEGPRRIWEGERPRKKRG